MAGTKTQISEDQKRHTAEILASRLPALFLQAEHLANSFKTGTHGRRKSGQGRDFWQFRDYEKGDERSHIDWRQSAKRRSVQIRQQELETTESIWFQIENTPGMGFKSPDLTYTKQETAALLCLALAILLNKGEEDFGLLTVQAKAGHGKLHLERFAKGLLSGDNIVSTTNAATRSVVDRTKVVIASDFLADRTQIDQQISALAEQGNFGLLVHIADPAEISLPYSGRVTFEDMVGGDTLTIGRVEKIRDDYIKAFEEHRAYLSAKANSLGWSYHFVKTDAPLQSNLTALFQILKGRG
jgi:uncharacterized protein (DUF58 family)